MEEGSCSLQLFLGSESCLPLLIARKALVGIAKAIVSLSLFHEGRNHRPPQPLVCTQALHSFRRAQKFAPGDKQFRGNTAVLQLVGEHPFTLGVFFCWFL